MQLFKLIFVVAAMAAGVGRYLQEMHRLTVIKRLPPAEARRYYESTRQRSETMMLVVTGVLMAGAVAALVYTFVIPK